MVQEMCSDQEKRRLYSHAVCLISLLATACGVLLPLISAAATT